MLSWHTKLFLVIINVIGLYVHVRDTEWCIFSLDLGHMEERDTDEITHSYPAVSSSTVLHEPDIKTADTICNNSLNNMPSSALNFLKPQTDRDAEEKKYVLATHLPLNFFQHEDMKSAETKVAGDTSSNSRFTVKHEPYMQVLLQ